MSIGNSAICETRGKQVPFGADAGRPGISTTNQARTGGYSLPAICRSPAWRAPTVRRGEPSGDWEVREEGKYYIPDVLTNDDYECDRALYVAADAHTEGHRKAMALLDDAENLLAVLLASMEQETDARAMQAEAVLKVVTRKLRKAHTRIDRQDTRDRNLFLAYFDLKARSGNDAR